MKNLVLFLLFFIFSLQTILSQQTKVPFEVHQMLYYENLNCSNSNFQSKYTVVYQNFHDASKHAVYFLNSFSDEAIVLYLMNQNKVIHNERFASRDFNAASIVELNIHNMKNINDVAQLQESNIKLKYVKKENVIRENRMLTAYHFKVKNYGKAKTIIYYIDHGSTGIPFSFHESFYTEMQNEGFPLIGNVMQRDEISRDGQVCSYMLKSIQKPNKKFNLYFK